MACKYQFIEKQQGDSMLFGFSNKGSTFYTELYDNHRWYCACSGSAYRYIVFSGETYTTPCTLTLNKNSFTATGNMYAQPNATALTDNPIEMYIFAWNSSGKAEFINKGARIYYLKITNEKGNCVANFIPCYKKILNSETIKGMYDIVEGKFYTNQGTGEFIAGPEV